MQQTWQRLLVLERLDGSSLPFVHARIIPSGTEATPWRVPIYVKRVLPVLAVAALLAPASQARSEGGGTSVAFVTAETINELLAISLPDGRVLKRLRIPADPENVEASDRTAVVVSTRAAAVTLVDLERRRVTRRVYVGYGAHHMTEDGPGNWLWIALGERARSIAVVDVSNPARPRLSRHVDPLGSAHDLAFSPGSARVWVTYGDRSQVGVFSALTGKLVRLIRVGSAPQHVLFGPAGSGGHAYVTSGDDGTLRIFSARTGRLLHLVHTSFGSFNLATYGSFVATSSLYRGTLMEFDENGHREVTSHVDTAARDVAVATLP